MPIERPLLRNSLDFFSAIPDVAISTMTPLQAMLRTENGILYHVWRDM
jgi:hypothetical protein